MKRIKDLFVGVFTKENTPILKNARFGDLFKTNEGTTVVYIGTVDDENILATTIKMDYGYTLFKFSSYDVNGYPSKREMELSDIEIRIVSRETSDLRDDMLREVLRHLENGTTEKLSEYELADIKNVEKRICEIVLSYGITPAL